MNRIGTLRLNVAVDDQPTAFAMRQKLRSEWRERLMPILDVNLKRLNTGNRWLHIKKLEIKVKLSDGKILNDDFYHQCYHELNRLFSSLPDSFFRDYPEGNLPISLEDNALQVVGLDLDENSVADLQPTIRTELELLLSYLTSGRVLWFIEVSEFKEILSKGIRAYRPELMTVAINSRQLAVWFRTIDLLLSFADSDWGDELMDQLSTKDLVLIPVYRRMLHAWIERSDIQTRLKIEKILIILTFSYANYFYDDMPDFEIVTPEVNVSTWQALIGSITDWSDDELDLLASTLPGMLKTDKRTTLQTSDIRTTKKQATTDAMQAITRQGLLDKKKAGPGDTFQFTVQKEDVIPVKVEYAGLVILAPFLSQFLRSRGVETNDTRINFDHLPKAAALLYALVQGNDECREYDLGFIKILLGIDLDSPILIVPGELSKDDFEEIENLIHAVIGHWTAVGNLSIEGFRRSFLERTAMLTEESEGWTLTFERAGHDVLIDWLPWTLQMVRLPWMQKTINVSW